eukprot:scaffold3953_cov169-Amphora_coffeaeformis.AAC.16
MESPCENPSTDESFSKDILLRFSLYQEIVHSDDYGYISLGESTKIFSLQKLSGEEDNLTVFLHTNDGRRIITNDFEGHLESISNIKITCEAPEEMEKDLRESASHLAASLLRKVRPHLIRDTLPTLTLARLDFSIVFKSFVENKFYRNKLDLELHDMLEVSRDGARVVREMLRQTTSDRSSGLQFFGYCPPRLFEAIMSGLQKHNSLPVTGMEELSEENAGAFAKFWNMRPSEAVRCDSFRFCASSFGVPALARLVRYLGPETGPSMVELSDMALEVAHAPLLGRLFAEKWTQIRTLELKKLHIPAPVFAVFCRNHRLHENIQYLVIEECTIEGCADDLTFLFENCQDLRRFEVKKTSLDFCDASTWEALVRNPPEYDTTLIDIFNDHRSWAVVCEGMFHCERSLCICWNLSDRLELSFEEDSGTEVDLTLRSSNFYLNDVRWFVDLVHEMCALRINQILRASCSHVDSDVQICRLLVDLVASPSVTRLELRHKTREDVLRMVCTVLPWVSPKLATLSLLWDDENSDDDEASSASEGGDHSASTGNDALMAKFVKTLEKNTSLFSIENPMGRALPFLKCIAIRNKVWSLSGQPSSLIPRLLGDPPLIKYTSEFREITMHTESGKRLMVAFEALHVFANDFGSTRDGK